MIEDLREEEDEVGEEREKTITEKRRRDKEEIR